MHEMHLHYQMVDDMPVWVARHVRWLSGLIMDVQLSDAIKGALAKEEHSEPPEANVRRAVHHKVSW